MGWFCLVVKPCTGVLLYYTVSVLGQDVGYTVKYNPLSEEVPEGEAQGNS